MDDNTNENNAMPQEGTTPEAQPEAAPQEEAKPEGEAAPAEGGEESAAM